MFNVSNFKNKYKSIKNFIIFLFHLLVATPKYYLKIPKKNYVMVSFILEQNERVTRSMNEKNFF